MGFGFNSPVYSNFKIIIKKTTDDDEVEKVSPLLIFNLTSPKELVHVAKLNCANSKVLRVRKTLFTNG